MLQTRARLVGRLQSASRLRQVTHQLQRNEHYSLTSTPHSRQMSSMATEEIDRKSRTAMQKAFDPKEVEAGWDAVWQQHINTTRESDAFRDRPTFSVVFPPPNITGVLHIGHALTTAIQDAFVRWHRMQGHNVVFIPGLDHAGIATQSVVEKKLLAERNVTRHELGREAFVAEVQQWAVECGGRIRSQLHRLGGSFDWKLESYTLDEVRSKVVRDAFIQLYRDGLIYRQARMVNWCPHLRTAISDIEVDVVQVSGHDKLKVPGRLKPVDVGLMHTFAYPLETCPREDWHKGTDPTANGRTHIWVGTTRLETMLGDVAVAISSADSRYSHLAGKYVIHPITQRTIPIIVDDILVDPTIGTGAVKITPAHDANDLACAQTHNLPIESMLDDCGAVQLRQEIPRYQGVNRFDAREKVLTDLTELGLYVGSKPHAMAIAVCSRSGDILEPLVKPQWFVQSGELAAIAATAVRNNSLSIQPSAFKKEWFRWLDNIQDWCISRQLWWGHRIPAWRFVNLAGNDQWIVAQDEAAARADLKASNPELPEDIELQQDTDVLDTWFSSGLFPISVFGASGKPASAHYPLALMETGSDILFFWVARMAMLCMHLTGEVPFRDVFMHPVVRDRLGRKMSKSLGNVIDPLHVMDGVSLQQMIDNVSKSALSKAEIKKAITQIKEEFPAGIPACGADALRLSLSMYMKGHGGGGDGGPSSSINLDLTRIHATRLFCNKMWNATRFVLQQAGVSPDVAASQLSLPRNVPDQWILSRLAQTVHDVNQHFQNHDIGSAAFIIHDFFLHDFCDTYIEWSKDPAASPTGATNSILHLVLNHCLRMFHPFMPFLSDELFQRLRWGLDVSVDSRPSNTLLAMPFPTDGFLLSVQAGERPRTLQSFVDPTAEGHMELLCQVLSTMRSLAKMAVDILGKESAKEATIEVRCQATRDVEVIAQHKLAMLRQLKVDDHRFSVFVDSSPLTNEEPSFSAAALPNVFVLVKLPISTGTLDGLEAEITKLTKKLAKLQTEQMLLSARVNASSFSKMPLAVQEKDKTALVELNAKDAALQSSLAQLRHMLNTTKARLFI